ncbi:AraC family transcriptional regulator [Paenibacillus sp. CC-CFT747]|nr:AraC family transcriptional regulator [Paenibacillus sp. CC-CFT747]
MGRLNEYPSEYAEFLFHTPNEEQQSLGLWPVQAGRNMAKPHYLSGPRQIRYYNVHLILDGKAAFRSGNRGATLGKGSLFVLFPGTTFQYSAVPGERKLRMTWIGFNGPAAGPLLKQAGLEESRPFWSDVPVSGLPAKFRELLHEYRQLGIGGTSLQLISHLYGLFSQLAAAGQKDMEKQAQPAWLHQCLSYMNSHYAKGLTVQDAASFAGLHRTHFSAVFSEKMGQSPLQYLQRLRMQHASHLLEETDWTVTDIALSLGYPDLYSFTRAFRNYYGLPPTEFRADRLTDGYV